MRNDELNINNDELVDMVLLQAEAIQILIGKVEKLETGIDKLEKDLTDKIGQLEKRADILVLKELRETWQKMIYEKNPSLQSDISMPIVTNALTHGLSMAGYLFVNPGDKIILSNQFSIIDWVIFKPFLWNCTGHYTW